MTLQRIEMRVTVTLPNDEKLTGTWQLDASEYWDADDAYAHEFHKNESTWCASNFLDAESNGEIVTWDRGSEGAWSKLKSLSAPDDDRCLCNVLYFEFLRVVP